ncbi:MAG: anti-sigma factor antagonist [Candidatus Hydrogenedentes bacterium]|nr:anti-sigma factor antagonist [Candidatus Hydrogenedentota bacterium]
MAIEIEKTEQDGNCLIQVRGEVDLYTSPDLRAAILKAVPKNKRLTLAVDLSQVPYMDSSGVATLVEGLKACHAKKAAFCLVDPSMPVMKVLQLARLDSVFDVREKL